MSHLPEDQSAREQALNCAHSYIIQAPAGSGKTELLTQRYLALVANVEAPEEILAITFSRKAANEMRERIIKSLKIAQASNKPPEKAHEQTTWRLARAVLQQNELHQWHLIENPQRLEVQTIDGFCSGLTRKLPYLSGLGTEATTTERPGKLYLQAAQETIKHIDGEDELRSNAIATLLFHLDGNQSRAETLLAEMLARRDQWLRHLVHEQNNFADFRLFLEDSLGQLIAQELESFNEQVSYEQRSNLLKFARYAQENLQQANKQHQLSQLCIEELETEINQTNYLNWQILFRWLLTSQGKTIRKTMNVNAGIPAATAGEDAAQKAYFKQMKTELTELLVNLRDSEQSIVSFSTLPAIRYEEQDWHLIEALMSCLTLATGILHTIFAQQGEMDFQEVSIRALSALGDDENPTDLSLALDYQLKHILIDEFQDTSHGQFQLLEKLIYGWLPDDGRSLFLVGDPMQSIYRFREADVGLFLKAQSIGIADVKPISLKLTVNFRSKEGIVSWVNQQFQHLLPSKENIVEGAVKYSQSIARDKSDDGRVESYGFYNELGEAEKIVSLVEQHCAEYPDKSLAILVKSRSQLANLVPAIQAAGIKFRATDIEQLGHRPLITDLQMLQRALTDFGDRIAWLAILRAPWCGLTLKDLLILGSNKNSSLYERSNDTEILNKLSPDGRHRLMVLMQKITPWLIRNSKSDTRANVEGCWLSLDGPKYVIELADLQAAELYFDLISAYSQGGVIKDPNELNDELTTLYAPVAVDANPQLEMMTIHKSKGLEFDTVILPGLNRGQAQDEQTLLRWMPISLDKGNELLIAPIHEHKSQRNIYYDFLANIERKKRDYEAGRQLYVACTRPERRLILTATMSPKEELAPDALKPKSGSQLHSLWSSVADDFINDYNTHLQQQNQVSTESDDESIIPQLRRIIDVEHFVCQNVLDEQIDYEVQKPLSTDETAHQNASLMKRHVGTITHGWLEQIADYVEHWSIEKITSYQPAIKNQLRQLGVSLAELETATQLVMKNLCLTLADKQGQFILQKHQQSATELSIERLEEDGFKHYVIDRTFIYKEGIDKERIRWIIDYKTSSYSGPELEQFINKQQQDYSEQLERYASLMKEMESNKIRLALYFTQHQILRSWDYTD